MNHSVIPDIPYATIKPRRGACIHSAASVAQADLYLLEWQGRPALLKDFSARPWLVRVTWSRFVTAREVRALKYLDGLPGVPKLYATASREAFIMERLDGDRLPRRKETPPPPEFWQAARQLLEQFHARGVGHGDLRRKNILIGPAGQAYFIDFATSVFRQGDGSSCCLANFIFHRYCRVDKATFAKIKASYKKARLDAEEQAWLNDVPWYLWLGRFWKRWVYQLRKGQFWRDKLRKSTRWLRRR